MSDTKLYRAATLREALEQIKRELGDDALVLGHKQVRVGGVLGIGSRELVEVQVKANPASRLGTGRAQENSKPNTPAKTLESANTEQKSALNLTALATRAYSEISGYQPTPSQNNSALERPTFERPVLEAPTVAHRLTKPAPLPAKASTAAASGEITSTRASSVASELVRLRSEFRELKFSLALFGNSVLQNSASQERSAQFDADPRIYDSPYYEAYLELLNTGLAPEITRHVMQAVVRNADKGKTVESALADSLDLTLRFAEDQLTINPGVAGSPIATVFIGPTGVGKTTTIAKLAAHVTLAARRPVEMITLDTYRIAAPEQLKRYSEMIGAGFHIARSVAELDELKQRFAGKAKIFIDTAGRSPNDLADQLELADYLRSQSEISKCLVLQATTHPMDALIAVKKFALFGSDQLVITKLDETTRPGAAVSVAADSRLPLAYICAGQRVPDDIQRANSTTFAARILRPSLFAATAAA